MDSADQIYERSENFIFRRIEDETILVPIKNHAGDLDSLFSLNPVGAFIWQHIDGRNTLAKIVHLIACEFDVDADEARNDLQHFMAELHEIGAVQPAGKKGV